MSDQDKPRIGAGTQPTPAAPGNTGGIEPSDVHVMRRSSEDPTLGPRPASTSKPKIAVGTSPKREPKIAEGTPPMQPIATPPQARTVHAQSSKRAMSTSKWNTFESGTTGVHAGGAAPHPGLRINQYEIIKRIGEGGMGTVCLARDLRLGRRVVIKFLESDQPELTKRFLVEARGTARCQHDNIVVIYEVGEHSGAPYLVQEFLSG